MRFESEGLSSIGDGSNNLLIAVLSALAELESQQKSEAIKNGIRWRMAEGIYQFSVINTLGYYWDHFGRLLIEPTEAKIVEAMRKEGITKDDLGREKFLERAWDWKKQYGGRIIEQLKKMGSSCDWDRERFTLDEGCSKAVREVFVGLYEKGLIYRGNRMVNWCPHCNTSISDAEVEYEEKDSNFWHLLYEVKETGEKLELATTRPETMVTFAFVDVMKFTRYVVTVVVNGAMPSADVVVEQLV